MGYDMKRKWWSQTESNRRPLACHFIYLSFHYVWITLSSTLGFVYLIQWIRLYAVYFPPRQVYRHLVTIWSSRKGGTGVRRTGKGIKISKAAVDAAGTREKRYILWDISLHGFGLCVAPSGLKTFVLRYRARHKFAPKRFINLGKYGPITPDEARRKATALLGRVANGEDPAFEAKQADLAAITIADACGRFLEQHVKAKRKPGTVALYSHAIENRIKPFFGSRHFLKVSKQEVSPIPLFVEGYSGHGQ